MRTLYLIRHAKSSWKHEGLRDFERPLNGRGKRDAPFMGRQLNKQSILPDQLISSPAKRAITTAKLIATEIGYPEKQIIENQSIYEASVEDLVQVVKSIDDTIGTAMLVGHNPGMTYFANFLSGCEVDNLPTCAVFCMDFKIKSWADVEEGKGVFKLFDYPKRYQ